MAWGKGRVPVGIDTSDSDFKTVEKTGGSKYLHSHTHTGSTSGGITNFLRVVGAVGTNINLNHISGYSAGDYKDISNTSDFPGANHYHNFTTNPSGNGNSQNLQPFIVCYMWKRTA